MEYGDLSEEQKAKVAECNTPEDLLALAREEGYELSNEELDFIAGGGKGLDIPGRKTNWG